ncbi:MAG: hypothetical protein ACI9JP_003068, partial [Granulosicoccus sp.]
KAEMSLGSCCAVRSGRNVGNARVFTKQKNYGMV